MADLGLTQRVSSVASAAKVFVDGSVVWNLVRCAMGRSGSGDVHHGGTVVHGLIVHSDIALSCVLFESPPTPGNIC